MGVQWYIRGVRPDYETGRGWASFHFEGAHAVCATLDLDTLGGQMPARKLARECRSALRVVDDPDTRRRLELLLELCEQAGDLGSIHWG